MNQEEKQQTLETTPILGILPTHTEAQIEARFRGYVQGVNASAMEATSKAQKEAAAQVGEAHRKKAEALVDAQVVKQREVSAIEARFKKLREQLEGQYRSELDRVELDHVLAKVEADKAFSAAAKPVEDTLEVKIRAIANDAAVKIAGASAEFTPVYEAAKAKRIAAEKAKKEAEAIVAAARTAPAEDYVGTRTGRFSDGAA